MQLSKLIGELVMVSTLETSKYGFQCHGILKIGADGGCIVVSDNRDVDKGTFHIGFNQEDVFDILPIKFNEKISRRIVYSIVLK